LWDPSGLSGLAPLYISLLKPATRAYPPAPNSGNFRALPCHQTRGLTRRWGKENTQVTERSFSLADFWTKERSSRSSLRIFFSLRRTRPDMPRHWHPCWPGFLFAFWVGQRVDVNFALHGALVGVVAVVIQICLTLGHHREWPPVDYIHLYSGDKETLFLA
jgi:hypothetical protein